MIFKCIEFPEKEFASQEEMFMALKANEGKLIELKRSAVYKSCEKGQFGFVNLDVTKLSDATKSDFPIQSDHIYAVISTTNFMDSHKDVHFPGCFAKTVPEQQGKVHYALDHKLQFDSIAAWPKDVNMFITPLDWAMVGKNYAGKTEAMVFDMAKTAVRPDVLNAIETKAGDFENSIRMGYDKIKLGINSANKDLKENKDYYDRRINEISNRDQAEKDGYFWGVEELRIHKEGSLVVAGGSNSATGIIIADPLKDSQEHKEEPAESSSITKISFYHTLI